MSVLELTADWLSREGSKYVIVSRRVGRLAKPNC